MAEFDDIQDLLNSIMAGQIPQSTITPAQTHEAVPEPFVAESVDEPAPTPDEAVVQEAELAIVNDAPFADSEARTDDTGSEMIMLPTFTTDDIAKTLDIRNYATLATLNTSRWYGKVKDKEASRNAALATGADAEAFETRKRLLIGADQKLKKIGQTIDQARSSFYEMTLPWSTTGLEDMKRRAGARLLPNTMFDDFITRMATHKAEMTTALDDFVTDYPQLVETAKASLGSSFDIRDYPLAESIRGHFDLSFDFAPVPMGTDFKGLPGQQCAALARAIEDKMAKQVENAMHELWVRMYKAVNNMVDRLAHPDTKFHYTLVENIRDVAKQLRHLNITGDQRVEDLRQFIEMNLCKHEVDDLRNKPTVRREVWAAASEALTRIKAYASAPQ
jgi:hypothetical protein